MSEYFFTMNFLYIYTELVVLFYTSTWEGDPYHIETSPLICKANQLTGFYMIGTSVIKKLTTKIKYFSNYKWN